MELVREICQGVIRDGGVSKKQGAAAQANPEEGLLLAEDIYVEEQEVSDNQPRKKRASSAEGKTLPAEIFRTYDIRGVVGESLTPEVVYELGRAIGSEAFDRGEQTLVVARDGRLSGPDLLESLIEGLTDTGRDVIDLGQVPTPLMYFATHFLNANSGVMLTGSHNPANYNGLKIVLRGETLSGEAIQDLRNRVANGEIYSGDGTATEQDLRSDYVSRVNEDVHVSRPLKVVIDCGNGVAGAIAPTLFRSLGCEVSELFCEVDGRFPNHHPDPSKPENLQSLILAVESEEADIGLAFDGDGDRLGVVDSKGKIIWPDRLLIALAEDVLMRQPGADIIYDVKCTRHLASEILKSGGRPIMWKTGHSLIKSKMRETGALLAGEMSGHIFFKERWYGFDDALYAAARLLEILSNDGRSSAEMFAEIPDSCVTPELTLSMKEGENIELMHKLLAHASLPESKVIDIDGLRAEFEEGWGLVRASNTTPSLVFRFEADSGEELEKVKDVFRHLIEEVQPGLKLPF
ncbi:MAG: phosphomannomutase/phosphoglucomutase [gamma proteobacterium symbiont of Bathyaustriella thionipta]|nr:phosphomannomutase/phosphoglucomutase [gamma proteobacterium symbiont of Bathyaustriella thionipta]